MNNQESAIPEGMAKVYLKGGNFIFVPVAELKDYLQKNEHLTNDSFPALRRKIAY